MSFPLSERVKRIALSPNVAARAQAQQLQAEGRDILDLTIGEPDFATPPHICQAAWQGIQRGETRYSPAAGTAALRQAVMTKLAAENQLDYSLPQIMIANGAKQVIFNAFAATLNPGDQVIIPAPYWPAYPASVALQDGVVRRVDCPLTQQYKLQPQQLAAAITAETRWLVLNNPSNPSGAVYDRDELQALAEVLRDHPQVMILMDELYEKILFDNRKPLNLLNVAPDLAPRCLLVGGVSKTYAMTGWRIGFAAGPQPLIAAMTVIQSQSTSGASAVSQAAAVAAFGSGTAFLRPQVEAYQRRRDHLVAKLSCVDGLEVFTPQGAFFVFCNCAGLLGKVTPQGTVLQTEADVLQFLLEHGVSAVGGQAFGISPAFRLSIAVSDETVRAAGERIAAACHSLSGSVDSR